VGNACKVACIICLHPASVVRVQDPHYPDEASAVNQTDHLTTVYRQMSDRLSTVEAFPLHTNADQHSYERLVTQTLTAQAASAARAVRLLRDRGAEPEVEEVMLRYRRCLLLGNGPAAGDGGSPVAGADWRVIVTQAERLPDRQSAQLIEAWQVQAACRASRERALRVWTITSGRSEVLVDAEEYVLAMDLWRQLCQDSTAGGYDRSRPIRQALEELVPERSGM
jgi:hypothetical protein